MTCNYLVGRGRYAELGETEDLLIPPSAALAGSVYKTVMAQVTAGKKYGSMSEVDGVAFNLKKKRDFRNREDWPDSDGEGIRQGNGFLCQDIVQRGQLGIADLFRSPCVRLGNESADGFPQPPCL